MKTALCCCLCGLLLQAAEPARQIFDQAVHDLAAEDYDAAERGFQAVLRAQPHHVAALSNLGVIYSRTHRADRAIDAYSQALHWSPDDHAFLLNRG